MKPTLILASAMLALTATAYPAGSTADGNSDPWHVATPAVVSQEIQFSNGDAHLAGTVYLPQIGDHLSAVVVLHHASIATRDAPLFRHLREALPAMGLAVLIYDRRGSGDSTGDFQNADYETLADDAIAGQHALAKLPRVDPHKIGFWGLSQGGWLAVLAAGRSPDAAFAISVSAPLVTAEEQMQFATANELIVHGYTQSDIREMLETRKAWSDYLHSKNSRDAALKALRNAESKPWFQLAYLPRASQLTTDPEHAASRRRLDDDPLAAIQRVKVPLLLLYGDSDPWIPVAKSLERVKSLAHQFPNIEYKVVTNATHEMMLPTRDPMSVDPNAKPQAPEYFMILGSWLSRAGN
jgi:pimeloyl-ACP methyl ester carboxylesterase